MVVVVFFVFVATVFFSVVSSWSSFLRCPVRFRRGRLCFRFRRRGRRRRVVAVVVLSEFVFEKKLNVCLPLPRLKVLTIPLLHSVGTE